MGLVQLTVRGYEETGEVKARIELRDHKEEDEMGECSKGSFYGEKLDGKEVQGLFEDSSSEELEL